MNFYTGVGSRSTPPQEQALLQDLAESLAKSYVLRSGGAAGADTAFEQGAINGKGRAEIYLPEREFRGHKSSLFTVDAKALALAKTTHPAWDSLSNIVKRLHARNCYQVLGLDLQTPSEFLLAWTPDGAETEAHRRRTTGGTATAIVLADRHGIPVFNLQNIDARYRLNEYLKSKGIASTSLVSGVACKVQLSLI